MKYLLILLLTSCCEIPETKNPQYSFAEVEVLTDDDYEIAFVVSRYNSLILDGGENPNTKLIYRDSPFAVVLNLKADASVTTYIDDIMQEPVYVLAGMVVIMYVNGNAQATSALLDELRFEHELIIVND